MDEQQLMSNPIKRAGSILTFGLTELTFVGFPEYIIRKYISLEKKCKIKIGDPK